MTTLALEHLYLEVKAAMELLPQVQVLFGWREVGKHVVNQRRVVFVPDAGSVDAAIQPGRVPRPLATLYEGFTVYCSAWDKTAFEDELLQYKAARLLFDSFYAHCYRVAMQTFVVDSVDWDTTRTERRHGACLIAKCTVQAELPDLEDQVDLVDFPTTFEADVVEGDVTESMTIGEPVVSLVATTEDIPLVGLSIVDGVQLDEDDVVLVMHGIEIHGLYVASAAPWVYIESPLYVGVLSGTTNGGKGFQRQDDDSYVLVGPQPVTEDL